MNPTLTLVKSPPPAVARVPLPIYSQKNTNYNPKYVVAWFLKATFPTPDGTVYLRYCVPEKSQGGDDFLEVFTPDGKRLQSLRNGPLTSQFLPARLSARWLAQREHKGLLLYFEQTFHDDKQPKPIFIAFPDGVTGFCSISRAYEHNKKYVWNGLEFIRADPTEDLGALIFAGKFDAPRQLPPTQFGEATRFGAVFARNRRFFLRWTNQVGKRFFLEILDKSGSALARHRLPDGFDPGGISALWLDSKHQRNPIIETRDSDQVRLHVFSDDFQKLLCIQDFNDGSSSISATTVAFERDKRGILEVWESYSERGDEDGSGGASSSTGYRWNGHGFQEVVQ